MRIPSSRYKEIQDICFNFSIYHKLLVYPLDVRSVINRMDGCRAIPYSRHCHRMFGNNRTLFLESAPSNDAYTDYASALNRHIVFYNDNFILPWNAGRMRWSLAHELGHIILNHHRDHPESSLHGCGLSDDKSTYLDREADLFASELLAPIPLLLAMAHFDSELDAQMISRTFGLSGKAGRNRRRAIDQKLAYLKNNALSAAEDIPQYAIFEEQFSRLMNTFSADCQSGAIPG